MNDAKGHASSLLILSLATAFVGAGILSWTLTQSNLFKERPGFKNSLAVKNEVSESIMTNKPVQSPAKITIPDINTLRAKKPDSGDESAIKPTASTDKAEEATAPVAIGLAELTPPIEKELPTETPKTEIAVAAAEPATTEVTLPETSPDEKPPETTETTEVTTTTAIAPEASNNEVTTTEAKITNETTQNEVVATVTEQATTEVTPPETSQDEKPPETAEVTTPTEITPETPNEPEIADIIPSEAPQNETVATATEPVTIEVTPTETTQNEAAPEPTTIAAVVPAETTEEGDGSTPAEVLVSTESTEETTTTAANTDSPDENAPTTEHQKNGWIYAGQYEHGKWIKRGLELPADKLPDAGNTYKLIWGTNVRQAPPGKRKTNGDNLAKNIDYLAVNQEIQITSIKNSGKTGHIWLEIKY